MQVFVDHRPWLLLGPHKHSHWCQRHLSSHVEHVKQRDFLPDIMCKSKGLSILQEHVPRIVESLRPGVKELAQMAMAIMP